MDNNQPRDYDAMFRQSQNNPYAKEDELRGESFDDRFRQSYAKSTPENPKVLDRNSVPPRRKSGVFSEMTAVISLIIAAVGLVLVFAGMYAHVVMFLNIVLCLVGVGFGIAALIGRASTRFLGIFGITGCVLDILIQIICMIVVAITSGISAVFHLLT